MFFGALIFGRGVAFSAAYAREGVEHVVASVHVVPQHLELPEHRLVGDLPPLGLLDGGLDSQQKAAQPLQALFRSSGLQPVVPVDEEGYGPAYNIAKNCRDDHLHLESFGVEGEGDALFVCSLLEGFIHESAVLVSAKRSVRLCD